MKEALNTRAELFCARLLLPVFLFVALFASASAFSADGELTADATSGISTDDLNLDDHAGKAVYINFWASWCGPCRASFPMMNAMRERYAAESLAIIAVNVDSDYAAAQRFLEKYPASFDIVYDPEGKLATEYQVRGMPSSYLLNSEGELVYTHVGFRKKDETKITRQIEELLAIEEKEKER